MVTETESSADAFLAAFFSPPNEAPLSPQLEPWLERLQQGETTVLPVRRRGALTFYGLSPSAAAGRGLAEDLLAAIGPSWSDFEGAPAELDPADPIEATILGHGERMPQGPTLRLAISRDDEGVAWRALERLRQSWARRPAPRDEAALLAPLPDLLRDVELALRTSAIDEAGRLIEVLRRRGELDSQNLLFLDLRLLASSGRWSEVLRHPRLVDVLNARRPVGVSAMLFDALDVRYFAEFAAAEDAQGALKVFRNVVADQFARLYGPGPEITSTAALQVRVLAAVDAGATREAAGEVAARGDTAARPWLDALAALTAEVPVARRAPVESPESAGTRLESVVAPESPIRAAREALYAGDHGRVLDELASEPASPEVVDLLLNAAVALGTLPAAHAVAAAFGALDSTEQEALRRHPLLADALGRLLAFSAGGDAIRSWSQWLARLAADESFEEALAIAEFGAVEWSTEEPANEAAAKALAHALTSLPTHARPTVERALPHLLTYLDRRPSPDDLALPIFVAILDVLAYGDSRTRAVREAVLAVLDPLLEGTPATAAYDELLECIEVMWADVRAARTLPWLADVLALLVAHACPAPERRDALMRVALNDAIALREVDATDVEFLLVLAADPLVDGAFAAEIAALQPKAPAEEDAAAPSPPLDPGPLKVGIYTLSPAAARQAQAVLTRRYPRLDIELNHEKDGSPLLRAFAQRADVLVVVVASATHAATGAIRQHCRPSALLEVGTKGSTGLVRAVVERLEALATV